MPALLAAVMPGTWLPEAVAQREGITYHEPGERAPTGRAETLAVPLAEDVGLRLRQLLAAGEYLRIEQFFQGLIASELVGRDGVLYGASVLERMFPRSVEAIPPEQREVEFERYRGPAETWAAAAGGSAISLLIRGALYFNWGCHVPRDVLASRYGAPRVKLELGLRFERAESDLRAVLAREPRNFLAAYKLLQVLARTGTDRQQFLNQAATLGRLAERLPQVQLARLEFMADIQKVEPQELLNFARQAAADMPPDAPGRVVLPAAHRHYLQSLARIGADPNSYFSPVDMPATPWEEVRTVYEKLAESYPLAARYHLSLANFAILSGRYPMAAELARQAAAREPENPHVAHAVQRLEKRIKQAVEGER